MDEFYAKLNYYRNEAENGRYHNPYDVDNELCEMIRRAGLDIETQEKLEMLAYEVGLKFWDM